MTLAEADPLDFTPAMRHGIACALNADPTRTYWGYEVDEAWGASKGRLYGCTKLESLSEDVKPHVEQLSATPTAATITAREVMEQLTAKQDSHVAPSIGAEVCGEPPEEPHAYSDGALKNNKGLFWGVGGAGVLSLIHI